MVNNFLTSDTNVLISYDFSLATLINASICSRIQRVGGLADKTMSTIA